MIKCKYCGAEVPQKQGKQAKVFCNDRCRKAFNRATSDKKEISTPDKSTPDTNPGQTDKNPNNIPGVCHGCGVDTGWNLVDICRECVAKGLTRKSLGLPKIKRASFRDSKFVPNYKKIGVHPNKVFNYIAYFLRESEKKIGNATFVIKGGMFEIGKRFVEKEKIDIPPEFKI